MCHHAAQRAADQKIASFKVTPMQAGAHERAHPVAGDFAERLNLTVGFIGGRKRPDFALRGGQSFLFTFRGLSIGRGLSIENMTFVVC